MSDKHYIIYAMCTALIFQTQIKSQHVMIFNTWKQFVLIYYKFEMC